MFVCRENEFFGVGKTPMRAYEDMVDNMLEAEVLHKGEENPDPHACQFFEETAVNIESKTAWDIQPVYKFVDEE